LHFHSVVVRFVQGQGHTICYTGAAIHTGNLDTVDLHASTMLSQLELVSAKFQRQRFSPHVHEGFCIAVVVQGAQQFNREGSQHIAANGQLLLINADQLHDGHSADDALGCRYHAIYPHTELLQPVVDDLCGPGAGLPWFPPVVEDPVLATALLQLFHSLQHNGNPLQCEALFMHSLSHLIQRHSGRPCQPLPLKSAPAKMQYVRDYLDNHCCQPISLHALSTLVELNPSYLSRLFRRTTGLAPHHYQLVRRIDHARQLIQRGLPLAQVALDTGFTDQPHFNRHFKRFTGLTPGRYQQAIC